MNEPTVIDRIRWRLCWALMPKLWLAQEKRGLECLARELGASKAVAQRIASAYFAGLVGRK